MNVVRKDARKTILFIIVYTYNKLCNTKVNNLVLQKN